jgi:hypothetical protein
MPPGAAGTVANRVPADESNIVVQGVADDGSLHDLEVEFVGPAPGFSGLDQVNVVLVDSLKGKWSLRIRILIGEAVSNAVSLALKSERTLRIIDFAPRQVSPGALLQVLGAGFPADEGKLFLDRFMIFFEFPDGEELQLPIGICLPWRRPTA